MSQFKFQGCYAACSADARGAFFAACQVRNNQYCYKSGAIPGSTYTGDSSHAVCTGRNLMPTFQTVVSRSLETTDAEFESLVVADESMSLGYRVPDIDDADAVADQIAAVAAAYLLAIRDGAGRPELTVQVYEEDGSVPAASYCVDADWARACVLGDVNRTEYFQGVLDTLASRQQRMAGKVEIAEV